MERRHQEVEGSAAVSYPRHPKAAEVERMLLEMRDSKQIQAELGVGERVVRRQARRLEMIRIPCTYEERLFLAKRRGVTSKYVP